MGRSRLDELERIRRLVVDLEPDERERDVRELRAVGKEVSRRHKGQKVVLVTRAEFKRKRERIRTLLARSRELVREEFEQHMEQKQKEEQQKEEKAQAAKGEVKRELVAVGLFGQVGNFAESIIRPKEGRFDKLTQHPDGSITFIGRDKHEYRVTAANVAWTETKIG